MKVRFKRIFTAITIMIMLIPLITTFAATDTNVLLGKAMTYGPYSVGKVTGTTTTNRVTDGSTSSTITLDWSVSSQQGVQYIFPEAINMSSFKIQASSSVLMVNFLDEEDDSLRSFTNQGDGIQTNLALEGVKRIVVRASATSGVSASLREVVVMGYIPDKTAPGEVSSLTYTIRQ